MVTKDLGFVLRRHNFRETSVIAEIFTRTQGKITGILKGFYTGKKEFSTPLEPCTLNEFLFYPTKSDIWLVSFAELVQSYGYLSTSPKKAHSAAACAILTDKAVQSMDPHPELFNLLKNCLQALEKEPEQKILCIFFIKFLSLSGFKPEFNRCISCSQDLAATLFFSIKRGGMVCPECAMHTPDSTGINKDVSATIAYIQHHDFSHAQRIRFSESCVAEIFGILQSFLTYHLEFDIFSRCALSKTIRLKKTAHSG